MRPPIPTAGAARHSCCASTSCVCVSSLFRRHAGGPPSRPNTLLGSPVAVCMLVTVVQNKFYLSLLYPEMDLALREPRSDLPQVSLALRWREGRAPKPPSELLGPGRLRGRAAGSVTSSRASSRRRWLRSPPRWPLLHGEDAALSRTDPGLSPGTICSLGGIGGLTSLSEPQGPLLSSGSDSASPRRIQWALSDQLTSPPHAPRSPRSSALWPPGDAQGSLTGTLGDESVQLGRSSVQGSHSKG